jgi:hypothetical protein
VPVIPAKLSKAETKQIREMAVAAFRACDLSGLARVDFLMEPEGKQRIYLNEVNTMPGFTSISMYPKLWEATGIGYKELITRLIELALERHARRAGRSTAGRLGIRGQGLRVQGSKVADSAWELLAGLWSLNSERNGGVMSLAAFVVQSEPSDP